MEFCATGDLSKCLWQNKNNFYGERTIKMISCQLLQGLQALHKNGIIHCNLKPSNILIDEYGNVKICDFKKSLKVATMNMKDIKKIKLQLHLVIQHLNYFKKMENILLKVIYGL